MSRYGSPSTPPIVTISSREQLKVEGRVLGRLG
jgi:hypothetical protein